MEQDRERCNHFPVRQHDLFFLVQETSLPANQLLKIRPTLGANNLHDTGDKDLLLMQEKQVDKRSKMLKVPPMRQLLISEF